MSGPQPTHAGGGSPVIFLNRYFYPDHSATSQMLSDLAFALAEQGRQVAVITSRQRYDAPDEQLIPRETVHGVEVFRVWTSRFGRHNLAGRAIDYLTFYVAAAWRLWGLARADDIVIAKTDPPMLSVMAAPITRLRGAKLVNWLQDIFPEIAEALAVGRGPLSRVAYGLMARARTRSLRAAVVNIALGERMAARLRCLGIGVDRIRVIANWADATLLQPVEPAANPLRQQWRLADKFVVGYSGNLGRAHDYATLLDAIALLESKRGERQGVENECHARLRAVAGAPSAADETQCRREKADRPDVVWLFIGGGALFEALRHEVKARGLRSVRFEPYQPRERLAESLSAADVHLVSLKPELEGLIVPSKAYGIAAAGRPTIFIGDRDGEIARLLARHDSGVTIPEGDSAELVRVVLDFAANPKRAQEMAANARRACLLDFDKEMAVSRWRALLAELSS